MTSLSLFDVGTHPPCPEAFNLADYVLRAGLDQPEKTALEVLGAEKTLKFTYGELRRAVFSTAGALHARGLQPGARVLLRFGNDVRFPIVFLGAIGAGLVPVPSSSQLGPREVNALIDDAAPALVLTGKGITPPERAPCPVFGPDEIDAMSQAPPMAPVQGDPNRLAYIIYTSGTSGKPRGVMHAHRAIWARRMMWHDWVALTKDDRLLHAGAFNWTYTLGTGMLDPWTIGATALIPEATINRAALVGCIRRSRATIFAATPGVYRQVVQSGASLDLPHLRHGLSAGEKLPDALRKQWEIRTGKPIFEALGMSEISTFISSGPSFETPPTALGKPQRGRRVAVVSRTDATPLACNTPGILAVSRSDPGLMLGYLGDDKGQQSHINGEWFLTGDLAQMDENGFVTYLGREDDMMNAGGYRVSPVEVETALMTHPNITEAAAVCVEVKADTFVIAAFYVSDIELASDDLAAHCARRLARYKCPRIFRHLHALPKGANGKLRRAALRGDTWKKNDAT